MKRILQALRQSRRTSRWVSVLVFSVLVIVFSWPQWRNSTPLAPLVTFQTISGQNIALESLRGKVVVVHFWATDCSICIKEMPQMVKLQQHYASRDYAMIAVAMWYDPPNHVMSFAQQWHLPFEVAYDPLGELARVFGDVLATPTTLVIDPQGRLLSRMVGAVDFKKLYALIDAQLSPSPPKPILLGAALEGGGSGSPPLAGI